MIHNGEALDRETKVEIAKLAKEGRWLVIFKDAPALLVFEQNHSERCVEGSGKRIAGHL